MSQNEIKLSQRLQKVANFVPENARIADIGSDHAYLPVALVDSGKIDFAVAGEVVKGPFESAKNQVSSSNLTEKIIVRLANGIAAFDENDKIDTVVTAGMGGILISEILQADLNKLKTVETLILQPNNHEDTLRKFLMEHDFTIAAEAILEETGKIYEIIVAKHGKMKYSETELKYGPFLLQEKSAIFIKKWQKELQTLQKVYGKLPENHSKRTEIKRKISEIGAILHEN